MPVPRILLGADSLMRQASGIGRVARLMARVLADEMRSGRLSAEALVLRDPHPVTDLGLTVRTMRGSQAKFLGAAYALALSHSHFIYDFCGIARAHPRIPLVRRPYMVWLHGIEAWEDARPDRLACARAAELLLTNTEYTRKRAVALHAGIAHARVCWLGTEEDEPGLVARPDPAPRVLILSRLDEHGGYKGHRELIAAWPAVVAAVPGARLVIAGDGPGADVIRAWADASPARAHLELLGFVPESQLPALFSQSTLFAMPSRGEGFGLAYIEAMRHGLAVIGSTHDAAGEINLDGVTGYNVDLDDPRQLTERIVELLKDRELRRRLAAAGQARWAEHFCYSAFRARFRPLLHEFLR